MMQYPDKSISISTSTTSCLNFFCSGRKFRIFFVILSSLALIMVFLNSLQLAYPPRIVLESIIMPKSDYKYNVLFWIPMFNHPEWYSDEHGNVGEEALKVIKCPVTNCFFTHQKNYLSDLTKYDAIIFHGPEKMSDDLPKKRSEKQLYVFASLEAPTLIKDDLNLYKNFYNLTMSYRMDSDVFWSYGKVYDLVTNETVAPSLSPQWKLPDENFYDEEMMRIITGKTKSVAWFASNCQAFNKRQDLVKKMQSFIDVDVYGKCGTLECEGPDCNDMLTTTYKFYLSFENSLCVDYVSEKLFRALQEYSIPVVFNGVADNTLSAPPKSFINANDYDTVEDLVKYLKYLIDNPKEYIKYFWWKKYYRVQTHGNFVFSHCNLCKRLNDDRFMSEKHQYEDIKAWFSDGKCNQTSRIKFLD